MHKVCFVMKKLLIALSALCFSSALIAQVPPPPPLPGQGILEHKIIDAIEKKDRDLYASLLDDNVRVFANGDLVATNRDQWMKAMGDMLAADGVSFSVKDKYSATGSFLLVVYYNSQASWGTELPEDCCWSTDAFQYAIRDGKIVSIRKLTGGD